ncbi:ABC transporter ATP-binding protein [Paraclostridium bifermentans]|uniref:ABC transporter ATP-binding protein n=1 Tax=Paraclostridium bifermentans TaxID=1490 RepID=UPI00359CACA6
MSIIEVKNITKRFNDKLALDNISFNIGKGEIFGLIGPNGAGKSTLINIMTNLVLPNNGSIYIGGMDLNKKPVEVKSMIGLVPQELAIIEHLTPYDNLEYFGALYGLKGKLLKERVNEALEIAGLIDVKRKKVKKLSGGMKRRLNIVIAMLHHPSILILDEPTVGVDAQSRNYIFSILKKLSIEQNTTIVYTSHYMEEVEHLCSKIFIIDEGREVAFGDKNYLKSLVFSSSKLSFELSNICANLIYELKNLNGVLKVSESEGLLVLSVDSTFILSSALKIIEENKCSIVKISNDEYSLEDVFLNLTGKSLR